MNERDRDSLEDLRDAARKVVAFTRGLDLPALASNEMVLASVLYEFVVFGEAVRRLSDECRAEHPKVPWRQIVAMRNIVTHGYDRIDEAKLWEAISVGVPNLIQNLDDILKPD